jgi:hypothetical protein
MIELSSLITGIYNVSFIDFIENNCFWNLVITPNLNYPSIFGTSFYNKNKINILKGEIKEETKYIKIQEIISKNEIIEYEGNYEFDEKKNFIIKGTCFKKNELKKGKFFSLKEEDGDEEKFHSTGIWCFNK